MAKKWQNKQNSVCMFLLIYMKTDCTRTLQQSRVKLVKKLNSTKLKDQT